MSAQIRVNYPVLPWLKLVVFSIAFGVWLAENTAKAASRRCTQSVCWHC